MGEAVLASLPLWKALGGLTPATVEKNTWDGVTKTKPTFRANGDFQMSSEAGEKAGLFSIQWQDQ